MRLQQWTDKIVENWSNLLVSGFQCQLLNCAMKRAVARLHSIQSKTHVVRIENVAWKQSSVKFHSGNKKLIKIGDN